MSDYLVSIIVPVYNVEKYLNRCVNSLINQTYKNLEIILVDDGSPDNSPIICDNYAAKDSRIKVIHKKNGGLSDARNAGIEASTGDYLVFIDSDDYAEINMIEETLSRLVASYADVCIWGYYADFVDADEKLQKTRITRLINETYTKSNIATLKVDSKIVGLLGYAWNKMYRTTLIKDNNFRFTKGLSLVEDIVFNSIVLSKADKVEFIEDSYVHYVQRPRETLGSKFYEDYFDKKKLAMKSLKDLLTSWGKEQGDIELVVNLMGFNALKSIIRLLSLTSNYTKPEKILYIDRLLKEESKQILDGVKVNSFKDKIIRYLMAQKRSKMLLNLYGMYF